MNSLMIIQSLWKCICILLKYIQVRLCLTVTNRLDNSTSLASPQTNH